MHGPPQQSASAWHEPPIGVHVRPDGTHLPFWQTPPEQQSESAVHVVPCSGMQEAAHTSCPDAFGTQTLLQQLSHKEHACPAG
jgi:hypothetical protein